MAELPTGGPEKLLWLDSSGIAPMLSGSRTAPKTSFVPLESNLLEIEPRFDDTLRRRFLRVNEETAMVSERLNEHFVDNK